MAEEGTWDECPQCKEKGLAPKKEGSTARQCQICGYIEEWGPEAPGEKKP